jgi:hypothetical protein
LANFSFNYLVRLELQRFSAVFQFFLLKKPLCSLGKINLNTFQSLIKIRKVRNLSIFFCLQPLIFIQKVAIFASKFFNFYFQEVRMNGRVKKPFQSKKVLKFTDFLTTLKVFSVLKFQSSKNCRRLQAKKLGISSKLVFLAFKPY